MQINQLEDVVGLLLFEQIGKKMHLTAAGREIYAYSTGIGHLLDEAEVVLDALKGLQTGSLSISVATTASHFATRLLAAFSQRYENVTISLAITNRASLREQLEANRPDLVIMGQPPDGVEVESEAFMENPLVMIASPNHQLASGKKLGLEKFEDENFVVREKGSGTRSAIERFFKEHDEVQYAPELFRYIKIRIYQHRHTTDKFIKLISCTRYWYHQAGKFTLPLHPALQLKPSLTFADCLHQAVGQ